MSANLPTSGELVPFDYAPRARVLFGVDTAGRLGELAAELRGRCVLLVVLFGVDTAGRLGELAAELRGRCVLLVTDRGLALAGHKQSAVDSLQAAGLEVTVIDDVTPNPTTDDVNRCLQIARQQPIDLIVGLGGGSSLDCAKGVNFLLTNGGQMEDYWGIGKASQPMLPMIAVPTTAGTGSEAQSFALIANAKTHRKMACGDKKAACRVAVLDPRLTATMPPSITAVTGIDAISHALETHVTTQRNPISRLFSLEAWKLLSRAFPQVVQSPGDLAARGEMQWGAHLAGAAIENSMLGAAHALANPLTAHFGLIHGVAVGIMLPHVIRYNQPVVGDLYGELAQQAELCDADDPEAADFLAQHVQSLIALSGCPTSLIEVEIDLDKIPQLAADAAEQWTGSFNPCPVTVESLQELYQCAYC